MYLKSMVVEDVYIVKSIANFFLVTVKADQNPGYIVSLIPTPSKGHDWGNKKPCVEINIFECREVHTTSGVLNILQICDIATHALLVVDWSAVAAWRRCSCAQWAYVTSCLHKRVFT